MGARGDLSGETAGEACLMLSGTGALLALAGVIGGGLMLSGTGGLVASTGMMIGDGRCAEHLQAMGAGATAIVCCCCCSSEDLDALLPVLWSALGTALES